MFKGNIHSQTLSHILLVSQKAKYSDISYHRRCQYCQGEPRVPRKFPFHENEKLVPKKNIYFGTGLAFLNRKDLFDVPVKFSGSREMFGEYQEVQKAQGKLKFEDQIALGGDEIY